MSNRFRDEITEGEVEQEVRPEPKQEKAELPQNFFVAFFRDGVVSKEAATEALPFIFFMAFLGMVYIGNQNFAVKTIRDIDKVSKEVKELGWDFKTLKADLMLKSTQIEVAKQVDTLGLKEPIEPPKKLAVLEEETKQN